jgi:hypothetical protein
MPSYFRSVYLAAAGAFLVTAVWKFFRARQKFTLLTLMLFTFGVAIVCSVNHYVMLLPLLFFLAPPALEWTRFGPPTLSLDPAKRAEWRSKPPSGSADEGSEEDRMVRLHPSDADRQRVMEMVERATPRPPSPSRGEDAPKNSQFEI